MSGQPRVWSIWIYDRHCTLIFHADWSPLHNRAAGITTNQTGWDGKISSNGVGGRSAILPLAEQAKLVYGLVFSLRNMTRKLSPQSSENNSSTSSKETLHSFSTSTYTLAHLQTLTNYTFVMITDPVQAPTRRAPQSTTGSSFSSGSSSTFSGGGGIPATGGMTTTGVLAQISRGPWVEFVARNPACLSLERESDEEDDDEDEEEGIQGLNSGEMDEEAIQERNEKLKQKKALKEKEIQKQRLTGLGKSVDSEAFRAAIERVLTQNKLNAPRAA